MNDLILAISFILPGITLEVFWTSFYNFRKTKNWDLKGHSYLWMFIVYAIVPFIYKFTLLNFSVYSIYFRSIFYMFSFFALEFIFGYIIKLLTGNCPWDYSNHEYLLFGKRIKFNYKGIISLNYIFVWYIYGMAFEYYYHFVISVL